MLGGGSPPGAIAVPPTRDVGAFLGVLNERRSPLDAVRLLRNVRFPDTWENSPNLEAGGESYYDFRADLMVRHGEGLTKIYNHFHDPHENAPEIVTLRSLHAAMDRAVLDVYG